jgi:hypothetical protein
MEIENGFPTGSDGVNVSGAVIVGVNNYSAVAEIEQGGHGDILS